MAPAEQRQAWIADRIATVGHVSARDIIHEFGIHPAQSVGDFARFQHENPGTIEYSIVARRWNRRSVGGGEATAARRYGTVLGVALFRAVPRALYVACAIKYLFY